MSLYYESGGGVIIMPTTKAGQRAVNKYMKNNYDRLNINVLKGRKDELKQYAVESGLSLNAFIMKAVDEMLDDAFCRKLLEDYENDPDKDDFMDIEEYAQTLGIKL
jgi:hypothetical protein